MAGILKPKIGVFSFTGCEGCQLQVLNLENELLDLLERVEIVNFREALTGGTNDYAVALVEGSISTASDERELKEIRRNARLLIAIGACAHTTGLNGMRNGESAKLAWSRVYPDRAFDANVAEEVRPLCEVVDVDFTVPGCPIDRDELLRVLTVILAGGTPRPSTTPVCDECRRAGNECLLDDGRICFGALAPSGCRAVCTSYGESCAACRGHLPGAPVSELMALLEEKGIDREEIILRLGRFGSRERAVAALLEELFPGGRNAQEAAS